VEIRSGPNLYIFGRYSGYHNLYNIRSKRHQGNPPERQYCQLIHRNVLFWSKSNLRRCWALIWQPCAFNASMCPMTRLIVQALDHHVDPRVLELAEAALPAFVPRAAIIANLFEAGGRQLVENIGCSEYRLDSAAGAPDVRVLERVWRVCVNLRHVDRTRQRTWSSGAARRRRLPRCPKTKPSPKG
jgi:hypothetical protein